MEENGLVRGTRCNFWPTCKTLWVAKKKKLVRVHGQVDVTKYRNVVEVNMLNVAEDLNQKQRFIL